MRLPEYRCSPLSSLTLGFQGQEAHDKDWGGYEALPGDPLPCVLVWLLRASLGCECHKDREFLISFLAQCLAHTRSLVRTCPGSWSQKEGWSLVSQGRDMKGRPPPLVYQRKGVFTVQYREWPDLRTRAPCPPPSQARVPACARVMDTHGRKPRMWEALDLGCSSHHDQEKST